MRRVSIAVLLCLLLVGVARAQDGAEPPRSTTEEEEILRRNQERWDRMTPDERQKAIERLKRFKELSEEERGEILEKARSGVAQLPADIRDELFRDRHRLWQSWWHLQGLSKQLKANLPEDLRSTIGELPERERRSIDFFLFAGLFESQFRSALDEAPEEVRTRIEKMSPYERKKAVRLLYSEFRKRIVSRMDAETSERIAALPEAMRSKARNEYVERKVDERRIVLVTQNVVPDLRELLKLKPEERWYRIRAKVDEYEALRRGPQGLRDYLRPTAEEREQLRGMSQEEKRAFFRRRTRHWLRMKGIAAEEVDEFLEMSMHDMFRELKKRHPELFKDDSRSSGYKGRGPGRGPRRPGDGDRTYGPYGGDRR